MMNTLQILYATWLTTRLTVAVLEWNQATLTYSNCRHLPHEYMARRRVIATQRRATMLHEKTVRALAHCHEPRGFF